MDPIVILGLIVGVVVIIAVGLLIVGYANANQVDPLADRLAEFSAQQEVTASLEDIEMSVPFTQRVLLPIMQLLARFTVQFTPQNSLANTQKLLDMAGNPNGLTPPIFSAIRFTTMIFIGLLMMIMLKNKGTTQAVLGLVGGGAVGFFMPWMWIRSKIQRRQDAVTRALPDALDLMSICVEAGLGFDQAMARVSEKWENELALAFGRVIREIQFGKARRDSLRAMADSFGVADVTSFVAAIIQADQLGVSISRVLKIQAEQMRIKRRQRAEEKAQQAPIKMMLPMAGLIFPTIWMVIFGPAAIQVYKIFYR